MFSKKYNLLFIHIPKTAGSSITGYMKNLNDPFVNEYYQKQMDISFLQKTKKLNRLICDTYTHIPLDDYRYILTDTEYKNSIKFTVIRNPISKLKSFYYFLKGHYWLSIDIGEMLPILNESIKKIIERGYSQDHTFKLDNNNRLIVDINDKKTKMLYLKKYQMLAVDNLFDTYGIMKQTSFFNFNKDNVYILRFENLQNDLNNFIEKFSLPKHQLTVVNKSNAHTLGNKEFLRLLIKNHPKDMIQYVFDYYKDDFKLLNYNCPNGLFSS